MKMIRDVTTAESLGFGVPHPRACWGLVALLFVAGLILTGAGCQEKKGKDQQAKGDGQKTTHDAWWCEEHGVPEKECSLCSAEAAAKFKKEGDWCKIHDRAQSQCFKCDPSKYKAFEDRYVAKYGKKPDRPPEEEFQK